VQAIGFPYRAGRWWFNQGQAVPAHDQNAGMTRRERRLAAELRANLSKRKSQARARAGNGEAAAEHPSASEPASQATAVTGDAQKQRLSE